MAASTPLADTERRDTDDGPTINGVSVREDDIEPVKGIRSIAILFRGMSIMLMVLLVMRIVFAFTSTVPASPGVVFAEAVRLIIFAGLLWGFGALAVLAIKSHYDLRATRILNARMAFTLQQMAKTAGVQTQDRAQ